MKNYRKRFEKAKDYNARLKICMQALKDPAFTDCLPERMDYTAAKHQNDGKGVVLLDVDDNLIAGDPFVVNQALVDSLINAGLTQVYLFSSMKLRDGSRLALIAYLALSGIEVKGVISQADALPDTAPERFYTAYYHYHTDEKMPPEAKSKLNKEIEKSFDESESYRFSLFQHSGQKYEHEHLFKAPMYGAKTQMFSNFLNKNSDIANIIVFDDAGDNLLGLMNILRQHDRENQSGINLQACYTHPKVTTEQGTKIYTWDDDYPTWLSQGENRELNQRNNSFLLLELINKQLSKMMKGPRGIQASPAYQDLKKVIDTNLKAKDFNGNIDSLYLEPLETLLVYSLNEEGKTEQQQYNAFSTNLPALEYIGEIYNLLADFYDKPHIDILGLVEKHRPMFLEQIIKTREDKFIADELRKKEGDMQMQLETQNAASPDPDAGTAAKPEKQSQKGHGFFRKVKELVKKEGPSPSPTTEHPSKK